MPALDLGWQKFVGRDYRSPRRTGSTGRSSWTPVDQTDGYRFVYCLPFSATELADRGHLLLDRRPSLDRRDWCAPDRRLCDGDGAGAGRGRSSEESRRAAGRARRRFRRLLARSRTDRSPGSACAAASSIRPPAIRCPTRSRNAVAARPSRPTSPAARSMRVFRRARRAALARRRLLPAARTGCCSAPPSRSSAIACSSISTGCPAADRALLCRPLDPRRQAAHPERPAAGAARPGADRASRSAA